MIYTKQEEYEWVVGFIDGDGFMDLERVKSRDRFFYRPVLAITQKEIKVLYKIKKILTIGRISKRADGYYHYRIRSQRLFQQYLIPLFKKHPFLSNKKLQFKLIIRCLKILNNYTGDNIQKQHCLNKFQLWIRKARLRPIPSKIKSLSPAWFVGFFDSEGCISVQIQNWISLKWRFVIKITQSDKNYLLLVAIKDFLNVGQIYKERSNIYYWGFHSFKDLPKFQSLLKKYPLKSEKWIQYIRFLKLLRIHDQQPSQKVQKKFQRLLFSFQKQKRLKI